MRLGKRLKFNMMIAILLCMVFVVNIGITFASADYSFTGSSINKITGSGSSAVTEYDTYTDYGSATGSTGKYTFSTGTQNNQLSINYGFRQDGQLIKYDLLVRFKATYSNAGGLTSDLHPANDFSLNFANRNKWIVDMGTTQIDNNNTYYNLTSTTNSISGVMYYMDTLSGAGTLPVLSGVTFYTSGNDTYKYIGDTLTVELIPEYVRSGTYDVATHQFKAPTSAYDTFTRNTQAFTNWINYMAGTTASASTSQYMIYNAYTGETNNTTGVTSGLAFPHDDSVVTSSGTVNTSITNPPNYANTAYRYAVTTSGSTTLRNYDAITAGNKYYGGVGIYVIPNNSLITINVTVPYYWKNAGTTTSNVVTLKYSSDIQTITVGSTEYHYYRENINEPTYINVLDYIMMTAEVSATFITNDWKLMLNNISVALIEDESELKTGTNGDTWSSSTRPDYEIHNSTTNSPILVRAKDVYGDNLTEYDANISVTNTSNSAMSVEGFTVRSLLWYGAYIPQGDNKPDKFEVSQFDSGDTKEHLTTGALQYDTNLWDCATSVYVDSNTGLVYGVFTFTRKSNDLLTYATPGSAIELVKGVQIPKTQTCQIGNQAFDFWCSLEVTSLNVSEQATFTHSSTSGVEVIVDGYYNAFTDSNPAKIYIRNNTNQVISGVTLNTLKVFELSNSANFLPRDKTASEIGFTYAYQLNGTVSIKPNEKVLAYVVVPTFVNGTSAVITEVKVTATLTTYNNDIDLIYNNSNVTISGTVATDRGTGVIINNSDKYYEFRLKSSTLLTDNFLSGKENSFVLSTVNGTHYYYFKGIICPKQRIELFKSFGKNVEVEYIEHNQKLGGTQYFASNVDENTQAVTNSVYNTQWGIASNEDAWLQAMKNLYNEPSQSERDNAVVVTAN